jgi:hypothetical protein
MHRRLFRCARFSSHVLPVSDSVSEKYLPFLKYVFQERQIHNKQQKYLYFFILPTLLPRRDKNTPSIFESPSWRFDANCISYTYFDVSMYKYVPCIFYSLLSRPINAQQIFFSNILYIVSTPTPLPVAARSKAWFCGRSPAEIVGSDPTGGTDVCLLWVLCVVR